MECCINQWTLAATHLSFQLLFILQSQKQRPKTFYYTPKTTFYYTPKTSQTVKYLIQNLECHTNLVARNILYDRLYASISMA